MANTRPVWGADVPVSMPVPPPADEPVMVTMDGFGVTSFRLVHNLTARDYEALSVPVYAPEDPSAPTVYDDAAIDTQ